MGTVHPHVNSRARAAFKTVLHEGKFWRLDHPELKVDATLRLSKRGAVKLNIPSTAPDQLGSYGTTRSGHALGQLSDSRPVTLWGDPNMDFVWHNRSRRTQEWSTAIINAHVGIEQETVFTSSSLTFDGIDTWSRMPRAIRQDEPRAKYESAVIEDVYGTGVRVSVTIDSAAVAEKLLDGNLQFIRFLGEDGRIRFETDSPTSLSFHRRLWFDLKSLLSFSLQREVYMFDFQAVLPGGGVVSVIERREEEPGGLLYEKQMILTPGHTPPEKLFPSWWKAVDALFPVAQVIVGRHYAQKAYLEGTAIAAFGAAEALHKHLGFNQLRFSRPFFKKATEELKLTLERPKQSPEQEDFEMFLSEVLQNVSPFRTRLRELGESAGASQLRAADIDVKTWIDITAGVRNKIAHSGSNVKRRGNTEDQLDLANHGTRVVLSMILRNYVSESPLSPKQASEIFLHTRWKLLPKSHES
ncbi:ApeA N-terminal domain 1-containing protein [Clavibacter phaseoli]|uniref:ApeA N-terminal domain 1-containing protein n=1 Tax=Clavibacter phaseoli TaxID=1734031 RepID=UPI0015FAE93F|nr:HEPN domain-containing protein [Clavibacter phaseoli]